MSNALREVLTMKQDTKIALVVHYALELMYEKGYLQSLAYNVSDEGKQAAKLILSDGYRPTNEHIDWAIDGLRDAGQLVGSTKYYRALILDVLESPGDNNEQFRRKTN